MHAPPEEPILDISGRFASAALRVARRLTRIEHDWVYDIPHGQLTLQQLQMLRLLQREGPLSVLSMASLLEMDPSTVSRNVALLARRGLLRPARGSDDLRRVRLELTPEGAESLGQIDERDVFETILSRIPAHRRDVVLAALETLASTLQDEAVHA